jgi:Tol biopolymer transport system component/tRNA A-37 threonylcarbamoyl transferase component Bud32
MDSQRWKRIEEIYHSVLELAPRERAAFIAEACKGDEDLRKEIEALAARDGSPTGVLDHAVWQRPGESTAPAPGTRLGPYEIVAAIGAGGMGQVYSARDTRLNRTVAIKVSLGRFSDRFAREARAIASLNHANICTLHDVGPDYLVMELIDGPTLADRIRKGAVPLEEALALARQIAAALEAAHERGIVHRDLKPANIKVRPDGSVKVLDFGLAKSWDESQTAPKTNVITAEMTGPGMILGTAGYMSPEQATGQEVDKRADIWSFGVVLYEMLTGERLFDGPTMQSALTAVLTREPDWDRLPAQVRRLLRSCLEKDPKKRLRDIGDAWRLADEAPVPAVAAAPPRGNWWRFAAAVFVLIAAVFLAGWWRGAQTGDRPLMRLALDLGPDAVGGPDADIALSPDARRIVFPVRRPDGQTQLATRLLDQSQLTLLNGTEGGHQPFVSADGQWIAYLTRGVVSKTLVQGGVPIALANTTTLDTGGAWDGDGNIATALSHSAALSLIPAAGGAPRPLTKLVRGEQTHRWPQFLPGGDVLFTDSESISGMESAAIAIDDRKTGAHQVVLRSGFAGRFVPGGYLLYVHEGVLFAVKFDLSSRQVKSSPIPLVEDLAADRITGNGHFDFAAAPNGSGTLVYLAGKGTAQQWAVTLLDTSGKAQPLLKPGAYYNPAFSPDGQRLALVVGSQGNNIFVYTVARGTMTRLTSDGVSDRPVWTPDAARIAFASQRAPGGIWWMRSDGGAEPELLLSSAQPAVPWSFSPDGKRLAYFAVAPDTGYDLWILPIDLTDRAHPKPGKPLPFLRTQFNEACPQFSPDGRWIAYASNETGPNEIYVRPSSGEPGKWQISSGGGMFANWAPNGRELYFEGPDDRIQVVDYTVKNDSFEAGRPRQWSARKLQNIFKSNMALSPKGDRFVVFELPDAGTAPPRAGVLLNFLGELKKRLP